MKSLLIAGHGIRLANAQEELFRVLEAGIPVATTFNGFDLVPNNHPNFVGRIGTLGTGNWALQNCDLLIMVGTRNNLRQVSFNWDNFAPQAKHIIVDIDEAELRKKTVRGNFFQENAREFLKKFDPSEVDKGWLEDCKKHIIDPVKDTNPKNPYYFIRKLTSELPEDAVVVCGNGTACIVTFQAGIVKKGQRYIWNSGCAAMGYDLPTSIGACLACGREVTCITGDGSIQMNLQELQTIKHYNLPIKIYVLNNGGYKSIEMTQKKYFKGDYIGCNKESGVSFPDFKKLADLYGVEIHDVILDDYVIYPKFTDSL